MRRKCVIKRLGKSPWPSHGSASSRAGGGFSMATFAGGYIINPIIILSW